MTQQTYSAARIAAARDFVAELVARDPVYLDLFIAMDRDATEAAARESRNPVEAARALARHRAQVMQ